jgi:hypothetical protein
MKKIILTLSIGFFIMSASAQDFGGGFEGGFIYSWLNTNSKNASIVKGRMNFTYGAFLDRNLSDAFTFTTGINSNYLGGTVRYKDPIALEWDEQEYQISKEGEVTYRVQYLETPFSIKGKTQEIGYITYFGRLGMNPAIAIKSRADIKGTVINSKNEAVTGDDLLDLNIKKNINFFNIGWHVGGGIEYSLGGSTSVIAELMFSQNFLGMTKNNITEPTGNDVKLTNSFMVLKAGIKF